MITNCQNEKISQKMSRFLIKSNLSTVKLPFRDFRNNTIVRKKNIYQKNLSGVLHIYKKEKGHSDLSNFGNTSLQFKKSKSVKNCLQNVFQQKINFAEHKIQNLNLQQQHVLNDKKKFRLKREQIQNKMIRDHKFKKIRLEQIFELRKIYNFFEQQYNNNNKSLQIQLKKEQKEIEDLQDRVKKATEFFQLLQSQYDKKFTN